ncbi:type II toxin-antitoxin system HicA family toxin [Ferroacidibacillus organovorans]|uniref:Addiction module toxin, HicA family n=1 Tax=Ferroacidibacillus organovorans TaxID=1765683 RepID=A0A117SY18_9BACL|nr:type II toxin-antitoxin system HicA family toxin [Ferroacidibacillus organovorans]KUO96184.1 hypothetical protein ATW55_14745 [Ferroacidibacillus organovorans]KUO97248.1 hypothetical protein ATW55_11680 [Ferroacidibacillus organovorans]
MSPRLPVVSGKQMIAFLTHAGFSSIGQKGSHHKMRHPDGKIAIIPMHRELAPGTLQSILRQSDMTLDALHEWLRD